MFRENANIFILYKMNSFSMSYLNLLHYNRLNLDKLFKQFGNLYSKTYPDKDYIYQIMNKRKELANKKINIDNDNFKNNNTDIKGQSLILFNNKYILNNFKNIQYIIKFLTKGYLSLYNYINLAYKKSDLCLLVNDLKTSYSNLRYNINLSNNPLISIPRDLLDKFDIDSPMSTSIEILKKYDKDFSIENIENEIRVIFKEMLELSRKNNIEKIKNIACDSALALIQNDIKLRKDKKFEYKYTEPFYVDIPNYESCEFTDSENPLMRFQVNVQECISKIYYKDNGQMKEKDKDIIENNVYIIDVIRNPNPSPDSHFYMIANFQIMEKNTMLI